MREYERPSDRGWKGNARRERGKNVLLGEGICRRCVGCCIGELRFLCARGQ